MFEVKKLKCRMKTESEAISHSEMLSKNKSVIDTGHSEDEKGWFSWFTQEEWTGDRRVVNNDE